MSRESKIEWTHSTFNIAWGCIEASPGCDNCYARTLAHRYGFEVWGKDAERRTFGDKYWREPLKWNAEARKAGERRRVFCSSMTDVFLNDKTIDAEREKLWPLIQETESLDWLILTKHPERILVNAPSGWPFDNVWLGVSVESNEYAWRAEILRRTPAAVHFLSVEPMLGPIDKVSLDGIEWVIVGGESGTGARPMDLDWVRDVRDRCRASDAAFLLKQLGGVRDKLGGDDALLDGVRHVEFPVAVFTGTSVK